MRYILSVLSVLLLALINPLIGHASPKPNVSANNAILMEQSSGRVLFEKKANEKQSIASITKVMTAIIAIESRKMDEKATTSRRAIYTEGSSIYLEQGEKMTVEDLVYGLMLRSGNDAAVAISEHIGGSVEGFVYLMNEKAKWIGMNNTHFDNPHGLESDNHYSTAYDMALLMRYAMENDYFKEITGTTTYQAKTRSYAWQNKNKLLTQYYDYCTGGKTGFTKKAGRTLLTSANKNKMNLIAVTLNAPDDWRDHMEMYEWGFDNFDLTSIKEKGKTQISGENKNVTGFLHDNVQVPLAKGEIENIKSRSVLLQEDADKIGETTFILDSKPIVTVPVFSERNPESDNFLKDVFYVFKQISRWR